MKFLIWKNRALSKLKFKLNSDYNSFIEERQLNRIFNIVIKSSIPATFSTDEYDLNDKEIIKLNKILDKYLDGTPINYIEGYAGFYNHSFIVTEDVLIPRFDSEILIDTIISIWGKEFSFEKKILELGVGSGNLSISLAALSKNWKVYGVERSIKALNIAKKNKEVIINSHKNIEFIQGDWNDDNLIERLLSLAPDGYDIIISNPPYLSLQEYYSLIDALKYEPIEALVSGNNGLYDLKRIALISRHLINNGKLLLEHGAKQQNHLINLLNKLGYTNIVKIKDLSGLDRAIIAEFNT